MSAAWQQQSAPLSDKIISRSPISVCVYIYIYKNVCMYIYRQIDKQIDTGRQIDRQIDRQTDRQIDYIYIDRYIYVYIYMHIYTQIYRDYRLQMIFYIYIIQIIDHVLQIIDDILYILCISCMFIWAGRAGCLPLPHLIRPPH